MHGYPHKTAGCKECSNEKSSQEGHGNWETCSHQEFRWDVLTTNLASEGEWCEESDI